MVATLINAILPKRQYIVLTVTSHLQVCKTNLHFNVKNISHSFILDHHELTNLTFFLMTATPPSDMRVHVIILLVTDKPSFSFVC